MSATRDDFELWLFQMDDRLADFLKTLPADVSKSLDYSLASIAELEKWLLRRYRNIQAILQDSEKATLDQAACYVGETIRKNIGGTWDIDQADEANAFHCIPVVEEKGRWTECPVTLVTASVDRRTGRYMSDVIAGLADECR